MATELPPFARSYSRPDLASVTREFETLARACAAARSAEESLETVRRWNTLRSHLDTQRNIAVVRYHQDTRDPSARTEDDFWNDAAGQLRELDALHARTLLASPHRAAIDGAFGSQYLRLLSCADASFAPALRDAVRDEAHASAEYTRILAEPEAEFRGRRVNLSELTKYFGDGDRATRLEAQIARDRFLAQRGDALDGLFDRLVKLRDGMGRALGHDGFTALGYQLMHRTGYGPAEVARFRDEIRREVVPLASEIVETQRARLGLDAVMYHDEAVNDPRGNPVPRGDAAQCLAQSQRMFHEFAPELGEFIDVMTRGELFDLVNRPGKAGGGFCTTFWDLGVPFVFANFNGTDSDIVTFVHECGHAFQAYRSRNIPMIDCRFPTLEACEVHSMGMEYLASPWTHLFFDETDVPRYLRSHLESRIVALPYMAAVDHFQHEVYARPSLDPAARRTLWREIEGLYLPYRAYPSELPYLASGGLWQRQAHVYVSPFYYIDYALAQTVALQLWHHARTNRDEAYREYLAMCDVGGSVGFEDMVRAGNMRSPFEPGCLREVVGEVRRALA